MLEETGIFIEEDFDYAHFIPQHATCFPLHGHTAKLEIILKGEKRELDMIIDFGELKKMVRDAIKALDHKLIVSKKYVKEINEELVTIQYGKFFVVAPIEHVYLMENEVTTENLSEEVCRILTKTLPSNIHEIEVRVYEGNRKGAFSSRTRK